MPDEGAPTLWDEVRTLRRRVHEVSSDLQSALILKGAVERLEREMQGTRESSIRLEAKVDSLIHKDKEEREKNKTRMALLMGIISAVSAFGAAVLGKLI